MSQNLNRSSIFSKSFLVVILMLGVVSLSACSTNQATGKRQFTALMSPAQENQVGAQEHQKIAGQFGFYEDKQLQSYVSSIGARIAKDTERPDVQYKFHVLDSPIVNAFALPGGYVYVSRGLLALANNEAELAAVLAHEVGHITGRHSAERYSRSVVTQLGASLISMAVRQPGVSDALGLGANLYLSSYSRGQENEADSLGIRYSAHGGYTPTAMESFLRSMQANATLQRQIEGQGGKKQAFNYFSTHPATEQRVNLTRAQAASYPQSGAVGRDTYLRAINGMTFGDSAKQGFVRGQSFIHPEIGFKFDVPKGFKIKNQPSAVLARHQNGAAMVFDMGSVKAKTDVMTYLTQLWMKGKNTKTAERIKVNGRNAATAFFDGSINGRAMSIRLVAIEFSPKKFARFQIAIPRGASKDTIEGLKRASYSFRGLSTKEKNALKPDHVRIVTAKSGDTVASLSRRMAMSDLQEQRFRTVNALGANDRVIAGRQYKIVTR